MATAAFLALAGAAAAQPPKSGPRTAAFEPKTQVDGQVLQVMTRTRALFRLDDGGLPVLDSVEQGFLASAHPAGAVAESYAPPGPGLLAAALDGSAEKHVSVLKVWNHTAKPVQYHAVVLEMMQGNVLKPVIVETCPVPPGAALSESWPAPIAAVALSGFKAPKAVPVRCGGAKLTPPKPAPKKGK